MRRPGSTAPSSVPGNQAAVLRDPLVQGASHHLWHPTAGVPGAGDAPGVPNSPGKNQAAFHTRGQEAIGPSPPEQLGAMAPAGSCLAHTRLWDAPSQALSSLSVMQNAALQHRSPSLQQDQALGTPPSLLLLGAAPLGRAGTSSSSTSWWQLSGCRLSHWVSDTAGDVQPPSGPQNRLFMETNDPFPQQNLNSEPKALGSDPLKFFLVACVA